MTVGERLRRHWTKHGYAVQPGAAEQEIMDFEVRRGVRLPADLRSYFAACNGMEFDDECFAFWPLARILPVPEELAEPIYAEALSFPEAASYYVFADYLIWSCAYAIRLSPDPSDPSPVLRLYDPLRRVAESFESFATIYLTNPTSLL